MDCGVLCLQIWLPTNKRRVQAHARVEVGQNTKAMERDAKSLAHQLVVEILINRQGGAIAPVKLATRMTYVNAMMDQGVYSVVQPIT